MTTSIDGSFYEEVVGDEVCCEEGEELNDENLMARCQVTRHIWSSPLCQKLVETADGARLSQETLEASECCLAGFELSPVDIYLMDACDFEREYTYSATALCTVNTFALRPTTTASSVTVATDRYSVGVDQTADPEDCCAAGNVEEDVYLRAACFD